MGEGRLRLAGRGRGARPEPAAPGRCLRHPGAGGAGPAEEGGGGRSGPSAAPSGRAFRPHSGTARGRGGAACHGSSSLGWGAGASRRAPHCTRTPVHAKAAGARRSAPPARRIRYFARFPTPLAGNGRDAASGPFRPSPRRAARAAGPPPGRANPQVTGAASAPSWPARPTCGGVGTTAARTAAARLRDGGRRGGGVPWAGRTREGRPRAGRPRAGRTGRPGPARRTPPCSRPG